MKWIRDYLCSLQAKSLSFKSVSPSVEDCSHTHITEAIAKEIVLWISLTTHILGGMESKRERTLGGVQAWERGRISRHGNVQKKPCQCSGDIGSSLVSTVTQSRTQTLPKILGSICLYWVHLKMNQNHTRYLGKYYIGGSWHAHFPDSECVGH